VGKNAKSQAIRKGAGPRQLWLQLPGLVREALYETVIAAGLACVDEVLEAERRGLCGAAISMWLSARRCGPVTLPVH
jgi:hypothetical protein